MRISVTISAALMVSLTLLIGSAVDVVAQAKKPKKKWDLVVIKVTKPADKCLYEITNARDSTLTSQQDTFYVNPNAVVNVVAIGTAARFRIEDDQKKKIKGFKGKGTANVEAGNEDYLKVRDKRESDPGSWHKVWVHCCESFNADRACVNPVEADDISSVFLDSDRIQRASVVPFGELLRSLFGVTDPASPPLPGGPGMDVEP